MLWIQSQGMTEWTKVRLVRNIKYICHFSASNLPLLSKNNLTKSVKTFLTTFARVHVISKSYSDQFHFDFEQFHFDYFTNPPPHPLKMRVENLSKFSFFLRRQVSHFEGVVKTLLVEVVDSQFRRKSKESRWRHWPVLQRTPLRPSSGVRNLLFLVQSRNLEINNWRTLSFDWL